MADTYILALDQGTSSSRAILFDRAGRVVAQVNQPFRQYYPQPGWVEHDPQDIWRSQLSVAQQVLRHAKVSPTQVAAIGLTNQRETTLIWHRDSGEPIYPAIVWQCRRTAPLVEALLQVPRVFTGTVDRVRGVTCRTAESVEITSARPVVFHIDGEPFVGSARILARVRPRALRVRVPAVKS